jgi:hypothetical protein
VTDAGSWYFTAPWEPTRERRGDALGLRAGADYFADLVAPDLNNGTSDARWITLLCWCLAASDTTWRRGGGGDVLTRDDARRRYDWLRPLELMWVDRALEAEPTSRQLRGRRSVQRWRDRGRETFDFGMSAERLRAFRQIGTYGAYRVVLKRVPGFTRGDGWTPGEIGRELAELVKRKLAAPNALSVDELDDDTKWGVWNQDQQARYWMKKGWLNWRNGKGRDLLPTPHGDATALPQTERELLRRALFAPGSIRHATARVLAEARDGTSHDELCDALAASSELRSLLAPHALAPLPSFTRLADAGTNALRTLWNELASNTQGPTLSFTDLARSQALRDDLDELGNAATRWLAAPAHEHFPQAAAPTRLARALAAAEARIDRLLALAAHHTEHGGGQRWFRIEGQGLLPLLPDKGGRAADYRFRLYALARLAAQCGVGDLSVALEALGDPPRDDGDDDDGATE